MVSTPPEECAALILGTQHRWLSSWNSRLGVVENVEQNYKEFEVEQMVIEIRSFANESNER